MARKIILVVLSLCYISSSKATRGVLYPFPLNTLLTCNLPNPFSNLPGEPASLPEPIPRIPLVPSAPGTVWLPVESGFRLPTDEQLDEALLVEFVAPELNERFSSRLEPVIDPPIARDEIGVTGSGESEDMLFITDPPPALPGEINDPMVEQIIRSWIASNQFGETPLFARWTRLPDTYYPPYYAGSFCDPIECSFPPGLVNHPDIGDGRLAYITVLRWDCCWDFVPESRRSWEWQCGWRKVQIGIIVDCTCACGPNFRPPGVF